MTCEANKPCISLGDYEPKSARFSNLDAVFAEFETKDFQARSFRKKFRKVNEELQKLILASPKESFLLPAVLSFIDQVNQKKILNERYHFSLFEFWLNHFSDLTDSENFSVRAKIAGKYIPREDYQAFFPIGMNKTFSGTHFVAAHSSPDVDTMVASFWGWLDAFAARVSEGQHVWSLPGGPPDAPCTQTLRRILGAALFDVVAESSETMSLGAIDLVTQNNVLKILGTSSANSLGLDSIQKAIILVDNAGHYLGDWHASDAEIVRQIVVRFKSCLHWFENNLHVKLISLFAKKELHVSDYAPFLSSVFNIKIQDSEPLKDSDEKQKKDLHEFLIKVLGVADGILGTFTDLSQAMVKLSVNELAGVQAKLEAMQKSELFDESGHLSEERPIIFYHLENIINQLNVAARCVRDYAERLDVALHIKYKVFGMPARVAMMRNDVEYIRVLMKHYEYLTVVIPEDNGKLFPVGVVRASELRKTVLGTVSFRDFCNQSEVKMASYLSPISVIDHHKASLKTISAPMALIGDAQSCNVLVAEQAFKINDNYSVIGMDAAKIDQEISSLTKLAVSIPNNRILQQLLKKRMAAATKDINYIHPDREFTEYLCFLHAILDDTDLLTKVSKRDVECVIELLNRMKSLSLGKPVEIINLDDIPCDKNFAKNAAKRILKNEDMYSFYKKIYASKESEIENSLKSSSSSLFNSFFADTKEQNSCCRVGQTKLFTSNFPTFRKLEGDLRKMWAANAEKTNQEQPEIDLFLHMISTIASGEEVYEDRVGHYTHQDEIWLWVPGTQKAHDHLTSFLNAFQSAPEILHNKLEIEFLDPTDQELQQIFKNNFIHIGEPRLNKTQPALPIVILRFKAGSINSRKAMITPYLPRVSV